MIKTFYVEFKKSEQKEDEDFITVGGIASSNVIDSDGDIITTEAMANAREDYMKFGAIREMHQSIAAGLCTKFETLENGDTYIEAKIYDKETIKKIKAGVLKAFSIGGKVIERIGNKILKLILIEISAVDRPANQNAVMQFYKADMNKINQEENKMLDNTNTPQATPEVQEPVASPQIEKSLGDVARLAFIVQELTWLQQDFKWESEYEGDDSEIPNQLKTLINGLFSVLNGAMAEETAEASANMEPEKAEVPDLAKAGARNSKEDILKIQQIHDIALSLGACSPSGVAGSIVALADNSADLEKSFKETLNTKEELIKSLSAEKESLNTEKETLLKRVKELEAIPLQKPTSSIVATMSKDEEGGDLSKTIKPVVDNHGKVDEVATLIKAAIFGKK